MGAASASTTGLTAALNRAIRITATVALRTTGLSMAIRGSSHAVARNEMAATTSVMTNRLIRAIRPPFHSHSTRSCVA